jgi:hypothetical protein
MGSICHTIIPIGGFARYYIFRLHKRQGIYRLAERLVDFQGRVWSMALDKRDYSPSQGQGHICL